jgi:hypothetical protein
LDKQLEKDSLEPVPWVKEKLQSNGIILHSLDGYSVKDKVTAIFERRFSSVPVEEWTEEEVALAIQAEKGASWPQRIMLSTHLEVPLYLVIYQRDVEGFRVFAIRGLSRELVNHTASFRSCLELAIWLARLKGITVTKGFVKSTYLSIIDKCLRTYNVPWPGNLDGFVVGDRNVVAVFEFRLTNIAPIRLHELNKYFTKDRNGWIVLDILRKMAKTTLYVVVWSNKERDVKILKVADVTPKGLVYESTQIWPEADLVQNFKEILATS